MTNYEIARRFVQLADILEIQGENVFKVRAYRVAAETINDLEDDLSDIHARGGLRELPGFGEAIASKTADFLTTGTTAIWEREKDSVPAGVVEIASVPGLGPKTVKTLWEQLSVESVEALEQACKDQRVRVLSGFGAAKEAKILDNIAKWRRLNATIPRHRALTVAERLTNRIKTINGVRCVEISGELRRGCDQVSEIVILVGSDELSFLPTLPIAEAGPSVVLKGVSLDDFERTLIQTTGPPSFLKLCNENRLGFDHAREPFLTEDELLGCAIPPELRDWPNVIELAKAGKLPKLVTEADFRGQLHEHTTYSDGANTIREMAEAALARGYAYLAITDHSRSLRIANGLSRERLLAQLDEITQLNAEFVPRGLTLLSGLEADILQDGSLDMDDDVLARLDFVVGSVHIRYKETEAQMTERIVTALKNPHLDLLGHPTGRLLGRREPYAVDMDAVIAAAATYGKALEINASPERMDLSDTYAKQAKAAGVKLSINCDAHSTKGLGNLEWGLCMARRAGLGSSDVLNTHSLAELIAWRDRHHAISIELQRTL